jgi:hypothetical protein
MDNIFISPIKNVYPCSHLHLTQVQVSVVKNEFRIISIGVNNG